MLTQEGPSQYICVHCAARCHTNFTRMRTTFHLSSKKKFSWGCEQSSGNNRQHHYDGSDVENTSISQFCLTSHSITSMGHARLVEILYICCKLFSCMDPIGHGHLGNSAGCCKIQDSCMSLSLYTWYIKETIMYFVYTVLPRPHTLGGKC